MSKFPKTIAAVQECERSQWKIGKALIEECGRPPSDGVNDGSYAKLEAVSEELNRLGYPEYSASHLAKLRNTVNNFPRPARAEGLSFAAHASAGSPEMLDAIVRMAGKKPITRDFVREAKATIQEHQARKHREEGEPRKQLPARGKDIPPQKELKGLAIIAELVGRVNDLEKARILIQNSSHWVDKNLAKLEEVDTDQIIELARGVADDARVLSSAAQNLKKRSHLSVVGE